LLWLQGALALTAANRKISDLKAVPLPLEQKVCLVEAAAAQYCCFVLQIALLEQELREVEGTVSNARNQVMFVCCANL